MLTSPHLSLIALAALATTLALTLMVTLAVARDRVVRHVFWRRISFPIIVHRHAFIGPWTPLGVFVRMIYLASNVILVLLPQGTTRECALRTGTLAIVNMAPVFCVWSLDSFASALHVTYASWTQAHGAVGTMVVALSAVHMGALWGDMPAHMGVDMVTDLTVLVATTVLAGYAVCPPLQRWTRLLFVRVHQLLALTCLAGICVHLRNRGGLPQIWCWALFVLFWTTTVSARLWSWWHGSIVCGTFDRRSGYVLISFLVPNVRASPGQYVRITVLRSWLWRMSRPCMVVSQDRSNGLTEVWAESRHFQRHQPTLTTRQILVRGPYGAGATLPPCDLAPNDLASNITVILVASDMGFASLIWFARSIARKEYMPQRVRRLKLVWFLRRHAVAQRARDELDGLLHDNLEIEKADPTAQEKEKNAPLDPQLDLQVLVYQDRVHVKPHYRDRRLKLDGLAKGESGVLDPINQVFGLAHRDPEGKQTARTGIDTLVLGV